jgi:hypothetical protein
MYVVLLESLAGMPCDGVKWTTVFPGITVGVPTPASEPCPLSTGAEHEAVMPPLLPAQVQLHGPLPLTEDALPLLHRFAVGALATETPFADPHDPLTGLLAS